MSSVVAQGSIGGDGGLMIGHSSLAPGQPSDHFPFSNANPVSFGSGVTAAAGADDMFALTLQAVTGTQIEDLRRQLKESQLMVAETRRKEEIANMKNAMNVQILSAVEEERDALLEETVVLRRKKDLVESIAADISNDKDSLERVISGTIDALKVFVEDGDFDTLISDWSLIPHAVSLLGQLASGLAVVVPGSTTTEAAAVDHVIEQSCKECESFSLAVAEQEQNIVKMREAIEKAMAQRTEIVAENDSLRMAVKELSPLADHCLTLTSDIERLKG